MVTIVGAYQPTYLEDDMKTTLISAAAFAMLVTGAFAATPTTSKTESQPAASQNHAGSMLLAVGPNRYFLPSISSGRRGAFG